MAHLVRNSKVRHIFAEAAKSDFQYHDLRTSLAQGDQNYIKVNDKFFAFAVVTGGGALTVQPLSKKGRLDSLLPVLDGHIGAVLDFDFDPFNSHMIASGGDDCTVKLWEIPEDGLTCNLMVPLVNMIGHEKKVTVVRFHPTANAVLATGSADYTVKIWDALRGECKATCTAGTQLIQDVVWNYDGSLLAMSSKDKQMHIVDPRTGEPVESVMAHDGSKTSKLCFLGDTGKLCSVGFTKTSKRQFKIWDQNDLAAGPIAKCDIDQASGAFMPFFDEDINILYLVGKGDRDVRFFEISSSAPFYYRLDDYRSLKPARGCAIFPKRCCDTKRCEVARFLKLTSDTAEPVSFIVPRKSEMFQKDIYPDTYAGKAVTTVDEFFAGVNRKPPLVSMDPAKRASNKTQTKEPKRATKEKSSAQLKKELDQMKKYVDTLQARLESQKIDYPPIPTFG